MRGGTEMNSADGAKIPDNYIFDARASRRGYPLNLLCVSLKNAAAREEFRRDEAAYCDRFGLTEPQRAAVLDRDWRAMLDLGGNIFCVCTLAFIDGLSLSISAGSSPGSARPSSRPRCWRGGVTLAEVIWGLATSHVPAIGAAIDHGRTQDPYWKPLFDGYQPARDWLGRNIPDVAVVIYNDHANSVSLDVSPTFAIGTADRYRVADEGFGRRPVPDVAGDSSLSLHLLEHLVNEGFDLTVLHELEVDHRADRPAVDLDTGPGGRLALPGRADPRQCPDVPAADRARCYALGKAIGRAIASFDGVRTVGILGTGGMSHQLAGARAGFINTEFDRMFLGALEQEPGRLAALTREDYIEQAGTEGLELIMWLVMRGAMNERIREVHSVYHVPASNTAAALALYDNRRGGLRPHLRAAAT